MPNAYFSDHRTNASDLSVVVSPLYAGMPGASSRYHAMVDRLSLGRHLNLHRKSAPAAAPGSRLDVHAAAAKDTGEDAITAYESRKVSTGAYLCMVWCLLGDYY